MSGNLEQTIQSNRPISPRIANVLNMDDQQIEQSQISSYIQSVATVSSPIVGARPFPLDGFDAELNAFMQWDYDFRILDD
jgi:hypothetical protein